MMAPNKKLCLGFSAPENALSSTPPSGIHLVFLVEDVTTVLAAVKQSTGCTTRKRAAKAAKEVQDE